jgi:ATP-dependent Zn protease
MGMTLGPALTRLRASLTVAVAVIALAVGALAFAPSALAAASLTNESLATFEGQLNGHRVMRVSLLSSSHALHVTLRNGRKMRVVFPASEQQRLVSEIRSEGVTVKISNAKPAHAKTRYILGGVAIALVLLGGGGWLLLRRRRMREEEQGPRASTPA